MANTVYDNFYLSNEIEDQYKSHLDLQTFCTVDNCRSGKPAFYSCHQEIILAPFERWA